ncbi:MAG TPA: MFS transporter [Solirubrobacteraceae bacterium]|jgi:MFS family permease|nr:MFS transporter [Solirubrobacteraceae bacterium]
MKSYRRVLRHRDFRYLFLGQAASTTGDRVVLVALALYITQRTGSATDLSVILAAQATPLIVLILLGGVLADRLPRHRVMVCTDLVRAAVHALLAVLILSGAPPLWELAAIEAVYGGAMAFFQPAYNGLLPQTVPEELMQDARALTEAVFCLAVLVGPVLGTAIVLGIGAGEAFAVDAATFLISAALLMRVRPRARGAVGAKASVLQDLRRGFDEVRSRPWVWVIIAAFTGAVLCVFAQWYTLAPVIARDHYGHAGLFGVLESCAGAGAVIGAALGMRWRPRRPMLVGLLLVLAWPVQNLTLAVGLPVAVVAVCSAATGFGFSLFGVWWETALAQHIPPPVLSRVSSYDWMGSLGLLPVGYVIAGPLAAALGARVVLGAGAVLGFAMLAAALLSRTVRELPSQPRSSRAMSV